MFVAGYTIYDAYSIRLIANPFTFIVWLFVLDGMVLPLYAGLTWRAKTKDIEIRNLMLFGLCGAILANLSFGSLMLAKQPCLGKLV